MSRQTWFMFEGFSAIITGQRILILIDKGKRLSKSDSIVMFSYFMMFQTKPTKKIYLFHTEFHTDIDIVDQ